MRRDMLSTRRSLIIGVVALSLAYFVTARLGLSLGAVNKFATLVWPPTGISLAALLIFGFDLWPGIFLGALLVNYYTGAPLIVAVGMGVGNTLEACAGAWFLREIGFKNLFTRFNFVLRLVFLSGFLSTLISASIGTASLFLSATIQKEAILPTWRAWWLGDIMGNLIVLPFLLAWFGKLEPKKSLRSVAETIALASISVVASCAVLTDWIFSGDISFPKPYFLFPILMLVTLRSEKKSVVTINLMVSTIAIWSTATGHGRFLSHSLSDGLIHTQVFLGVLVISQLLLLSVVTERRKEREALTKSNAQREAILDAALDSIITIDQEGLIVEFNPAAQRTFGYSFDEVAGKEMAEVIIPPRLRDAHRKGMAHFLSTGHGPVLGKRIELPAVRADGTEFPVEISIQPLKMIGTQMFTGFIQDISQRKAAEKENDLPG
jgi:PAS domain S-box-containing protein